MIGALERRFGLADLEKQERLIFYFLVDRLAKGQEVSLADIVASGICPRPSAYRHVSNLVAKKAIEVHRTKAATVTLAPQLAGYDKAFKVAVAALSKPPKLKS